jgi:hypothetical protein
MRYASSKTKILNLIFKIIIMIRSRTHYCSDILKERFRYIKKSVLSKLLRFSHRFIICAHTFNLAIFS